LANIACEMNTIWKFATSQSDNMSSVLTIRVATGQEIIREKNYSRSGECCGIVF